MIDPRHWTIVSALAILPRGRRPRVVQRLVVTDDDGNRLQVGADLIGQAPQEELAAGEPEQRVHRAMDQTSEIVTPMPPHEPGSLVFSPSGQTFLGGERGRMMPERDLTPAEAWRD